MNESVKNENEVVRDHQLEKAMKLPGERRPLKLGELKPGLFRVIWVVFKDKKTKNLMYLGVCGYSWKPAFIGGLLHALIVHDLYVDEEEGQCEEEERCLNLSCPLNKTRPETYARSKNLPEKFLKAFLKTRWTELAEIVSSYTPVAEVARQAHIKNKKTTVIEIGQ